MLASSIPLLRFSFLPSFLPSFLLLTPPHPRPQQNKETIQKSGENIQTSNYDLLKSTLEKMNKAICNDDDDDEDDEENYENDEDDDEWA